MSQELEFKDLPELRIGVSLRKENGKLVFVMQKKVYEKEKIKLLIEIISNNQYLPAKLIIKNKLFFLSKLKTEKLI